MLAASPNWLGSPQHFVAIVVFWLSQRLLGLANTLVGAVLGTTIAAAFSLRRRGA
jgi:hypothetical protein